MPRNKTKNVYLYSPCALEPWDWRAPDTTGIGGSETSHIVLAEAFAKRGYNVLSYTLLPKDAHSRGKELWFDITQTPKHLEAGVWLVYRDTHILDKRKLKGAIVWFIAQDVGYDFTPAQLAKIDRYICLCRTHARYTEGRYPELKDRIYVSTNGIRRELIEDVEKQRNDVAVPQRDAHRLVYASSPDRGLVFLLTNWFRIREAVPDATLHVHYGLNNAEEILRRTNGHAEVSNVLADLKPLLRQDGVVWHGRQPQREIWKSLFASQIWAYPTDWPETSCISCMEAQACGAIPITTNHWAVGENVFAGVMVPTPPQSNTFAASMWVEEVIRLLKHPEGCEKIRSTMMADARDTFDWNKIVDQQLVPWLEKDFSGK